MKTKTDKIVVAVFAVVLLACGGTVMYIRGQKAGLAAAKKALEVVAAQYGPEKEREAAPMEFKRVFTDAQMVLYETLKFSASMEEAKAFLKWSMGQPEEVRQSRDKLRSAWRRRNPKVFLPDAASVRVAEINRALSGERDADGMTFGDRVAWSLWRDK